MNWVIVLRTDQRELYDALRRSLSPDSNITVIYDRRVAERRRGGTTPKRDRRRTDRRQRRPTGMVYQGSIIVGEDTPASPPRGTASSDAAPPGHGQATCSECGKVLEFDLPRFPQAPARVEITAVHVPGPHRSSHQIEIAAFGWSGRPLVSQCISPKSEGPATR